MEKLMTERSERRDRPARIPEPRPERTERESPQRERRDVPLREDKETPRTNKIERLPGQDDKDPF